MGAPAMSDIAAHPYHDVLSTWEAVLPATIDFNQQAFVRERIPHEEGAEYIGWAYRCPDFWRAYFYYMQAGDEQAGVTVSIVIRPDEVLTMDAIRARLHNARLSLHGYFVDEFTRRCLLERIESAIAGGHA